MVRSSSPCNEKAPAGLKKGPWSPEEDQKLFAYIQQHGHGRWHSLPAKAGLQRCGKSCRLRWNNYLRPDIKRGKFTLLEEQTIIQLHALLGNRWSAIAAHVPMRTDNEIKNYWNTRLKKRLTKMGIDPMTHKPNTNLFGSGGHPKDAANLRHMAQWETARLEAEARLVRNSKLVSTTYSAPILHLPLPNKLSNSPAPPCLDILKAWQQTWKKKTPPRTRDNINDLRFSDQNLFTLFPMPKDAAMENPCMQKLGMAGVDSVTETFPLQDLMIEEENKQARWNAAYTDDYSIDHILAENPNAYSNYWSGELGNVVANCGGAGFEDNKNCWNSILNNRIMSPAGSPVF